MSIQEPPVRFNIPEQTPSSSIVTNPGNEEYDPFTIDYDDDGDNNNNNESEQLKNAKHQKQDSIRINNGWAACDGLGRVLHTYDQVGDIKPNKFVGIFYFLWAENEASFKTGPYDITKILSASGGNFIKCYMESII
ncbi:unnamed protein product [Rotaria sp. Silwood1]|nr:unnamed protein product [Rotaria sp. Silwood1]